MAATKPVILITGASHGLGAAMASRMASWATIYGTSRSDHASPNIHFVKMDVADAESIQNAVEQVLSAEGRIDILVNNAGIALSGASEMTSRAAASRQLEVNFLGVLGTSHVVLPKMREQRQGLILNISSMAAAVPLPFCSCYAASKAALEAWAWSMRLEVKPFGIGVCCVQVGDCQTDISEHAIAEFSPHDQGIYETSHRVAYSRYRREEAHGMPPDQLARSVERILQTPIEKIRFRYTAGSLSQRLLFTWRKLLPEWAVESIIERMYLSLGSQRGDEPDVNFVHDP